MRLNDFHRIEMRRDANTGLFAIFALHDMTLGPALGGIRRWSYADEGEALADVARLARGMTSKNAMANLPFGGGKGVVVAPRGDDPARPARPITNAESRVLGEWIAELDGIYVAAADVGMRIDDLRAVAERTKHVAGVGSESDTGPRTALGVYSAIEVVARRLDFSDLRDARVAVQGLGKVGMPLCERLHDAGATLTVADIDAAKTQFAADRFGANVAPGGEVLLADVDIVAPCALGRAITHEVARALRARAVAGAANNQLASREAALTLRERGVLYAPDYVVNAGGVISAALDYLGTGGFDDEVRKIGPRLERIFDQAQASGRLEVEVADDLVSQRIAAKATEAQAAKTP